MSFFIFDQFEILSLLCVLSLFFSVAQGKIQAVFYCAKVQGSSPGKFKKDVVAAKTNKFQSFQYRHFYRSLLLQY